MEITPYERMVVAGAREIEDGDVVFVGMRLPLAAFALARATHAPNAVGLFECGLVRNAPTPEPIVTMADPANIVDAAWAGSMATLMGQLARGRVSLGMIGGAQVDRYGNLNTSYIGGYVAPTVRLPGSGGASDIASLARRLVLVMAHEPRRFVETVDYVTSPGHGSGAGWREGVGLPEREGRRPFGGPDRLVTSKALFDFDEAGEMMLTHLHPGVTLDEITNSIPWGVKVAERLGESPSPTPQELAIIRGEM